MKRFFFFLPGCLFLGMLPISAVHAQGVEWAKFIRDTYSGRLAKLCKDSNDNVYVTGQLSTNGHVDGSPIHVLGTYDMFLIKFNAAGEFQWSRRGGGDGGSFNLNEIDAGIDMIYDPVSDAVYVYGNYEGNPATFGNGISFSGQGVFLAKYSVNGECIWVSRTDKGGAGSISLDQSGGLIVTGSSSNSPSDSTTFLGNPNIRIMNGPYAAKYSTSGDIIWAKNLGKGLHFRLSIHNGYYILIGSTGAGAVSSELIDVPVGFGAAFSSCFISAVDPTFSQVRWIREFYSPTIAALSDHVFIEQGDHMLSGVFADSLVLSGNTLYAPPGEYRTFVLRLDSTGMAEHWVMELGSDAGRAPRFSKFADGTIALAMPFVDSVQVGGQTFHASSAMDFLVARIDTDGNLLGAVNNGPVTINNMDVVAMSDGSVVLGSTFTGDIDFGNGQVLMGGADIFVAKLGLATSVPNLRTTTNGELFIYANPNNGTCTIDLPEGLQGESGLTLRILDIQGRVVQVSPLRLEEGIIRLDIRAQAKGTYVAEVGNAQVRYTGRIVFE